jgi:IS30 family transposase
MLRVCICTEKRADGPPAVDGGLGDGETQRRHGSYRRAGLFCDPQNPWQRGTSENTNLLLRQYFPRRTDLSGYSQEQLDHVSLLLNQRPTKTLGFQTPAYKLQASVASTA